MNTPHYVVLDKPIGQTPLEAIYAWKAAHPESAPLPATYAGRLDPMASGKLLVLLGEECKRREKYLGMDKEYMVEAVLNASTDTGDALGIAALSSSHVQPSSAALSRAMRQLTGTHTVPYPAFSSKTVDGIPLFQYALEGRLGEIRIPEHDETIYKIKLLGVQELGSVGLRERIRTTLAHVPRSDEATKGLGADFRQDAIRARWKALLAQERSFTVVRLCVTCASGTYMRTLARRLGSALGTDAFALSIHRTRIGRYVPLGPSGFWHKQY